MVPKMWRAPPHPSREPFDEGPVLERARHAELRDHETSRHLERTNQYLELLSHGLRSPARFRSDLIRAAPLHDIGMGEIPGAILLKAGPLTLDERQTMRSHCVLGDAILAPLEARGPQKSFLAMAREIVLGHHEKWNGCGYPRGLTGSHIPLSARMMAVADTYDALRSRHSYREGRPHQECVRILSELSGIHYDPAVVRAFLKMEPDFARLSQMSVWIDSY